MDPKHVIAMIGKAYELKKIRNHTEAVEYFDNAKKTDPRYIPDLINNAKFLIKVGNTSHIPLLQVRLPSCFCLSK